MYLLKRPTCVKYLCSNITAFIIVLVFTVSTTVSGYNTRYSNVLSLPASSASFSSSSSSSSSYLPSSHRSSSPSLKYKPKFLTVLPVTSASNSYLHRNYQSVPTYKASAASVYTGNHNNKKANKLPSSGSSSFGKRIAPAASSIISHKVPWTSYTAPFMKSSSARSNNKRDTVYSAESNSLPFTSSPKASSSLYTDTSLNSIYSDLPSNTRINKRPSVEFEDQPPLPPSSLTSDNEPIAPPSNAKSAEIPLTPKCLSCICHANTNCDSNIKCVLNEFCGPYLISLKYWIEAGKPGGEYKSCVFNSSCAEKTVQSYMAKNLVDCNRDGFIDCDDYVAIHQLGPKHCQSSQNSLTNFYTSNYWNFYQYCYHLSPDARREYPEENTNDRSDPRRVASRVPPVAPVTSVSSSSSSSLIPSDVTISNTSRPVNDDEDDEPPRRPLRRNRPKNVPRFTVRPISPSPSPAPVVTPAPRAPAFTSINAQENNNNYSNQIVPLTGSSSNNNNVANVASDSSSFVRRTDLTEYCMNCLCEANGCNRTVICDESSESYRIGSCGPFAIDFNYWLDAGQPSYPGAPNGFVKCSNDRKCSESVVRSYLTKFSADCNSDGVIDCLDYAVIHKLGPKYCKNDRIYDTNYWAKFQNCFGFDSNF